MARFILVQTPAGQFSERRTEAGNFFVNVETVRYVAQNAQNPGQSLIRFIGDEHALQISESAESFVRRAGAA